VVTELLLLGLNLSHGEDPTGEAQEAPYEGVLVQSSELEGVLSLEGAVGVDRRNEGRQVGLLPLLAYGINKLLSEGEDLLEFGVRHFAETSHALGGSGSAEESLQREVNARPDQAARGKEHFCHARRREQRLALAIHITDNSLQEAVGDDGVHEVSALAPHLFSKEEGHHLIALVAEGSLSQFDGSLGAV